MSLSKSKNKNLKTDKKQLNAVNETVIAKVEGLSYSASGVARYEGKVVFIPYTVTGDVVKFSIKQDRKTFADGKLEEVLKSSPYRRPAPCQYFERCGGCQWQHVQYNYQLYSKKMITKDLIERIGLIKNVNVDDTNSANSEWNYRQRVRFQIGFTDGIPCLGFNIFGSNEVVDIQNCHIVQRPIVDLLKQLVTKKNAIKNFYDFEVYYSDEGCFTFSATARQNWEQRLTEELFPLFKGGVIKEMRTRKVYNIKEANLSYTVKNNMGDFKLKVLAGGFVQANPYVNEIILNVLIDVLSGYKEMLLLELYSGAGNFTIPFSKLFRHVVAVEADPFSFRALEENLPKNRVVNVSAVQSSVYEEVLRFFNKKREFDVIFLDPPRIGAKDVMPFLPKLNAKRIVYLSCNPSTLARDIKVLCDAGYSLTKLIPFDMFPQTFHIECLAVLDR